MKKITIFIITFIFIFSSINTTFAKRGILDELLNISYSTEEFNLYLTEIKPIKFKNKQYNNIYNKIKKIDSILKKEIIKNYKNGKYDYYKTNGIITNYKKFIYNINNLFFFLKLKEENKNYSELNTALYKNAIDIRSNYKKIQNLIR